MSDKERIILNTMSMEIVDVCKYYASRGVSMAETIAVLDTVKFGFQKGEWDRAEEMRKKVQEILK